MLVECLPCWSYLLDFFVVGVQKVKLYEDQIKASNGYAAISYTADLLMANLHISQPGASSVQVSAVGLSRPKEFLAAYYIIAQSTWNQWLFCCVCATSVNHPNFR
jgi:hypothetical protein